MLGGDDDVGVDDEVQPGAGDHAVDGRHGRLPHAVLAGRPVDLVRRAGPCRPTTPPRDATAPTSAPVEKKRSPVAVTTRAADPGVLADLGPDRLDRLDHRGVQRVRPVGAVDRDVGDVVALLVDQARAARRRGRCVMVSSLSIVVKLGRDGFRYCHEPCWLKRLAPAPMLRPGRQARLADLGRTVADRPLDRESHRTVRLMGLERRLRARPWSPSGAPSPPPRRRASAPRVDGVGRDAGQRARRGEPQEAIGERVGDRLEVPDRRSELDPVGGVGGGRRAGGARPPPPCTRRRRRRRRRSPGWRRRGRRALDRGATPRLAGQRVDRFDVTGDRAR